MTVLVNGVSVSPLRGESIEFATIREFLRQRAVAAGGIDTAVQDEGEVSRSIETLLQREVATPSTEAECRRYFEHHCHEFEGGDLVHERHILFQAAPGVNVAALRTRAEQALTELLRQPDRFAAMARELFNCPSGQHGAIWVKLAAAIPCRNSNGRFFVWAQLEFFVRS